MRSKKFIQVFMVLLVIGGMLISASCGKSGEAEKSPTNQKIADTRTDTIAPDANVDIVYYFMTTQRCANCMKIEAYSKEAVETGFADALKRGSIAWRMVNVDQPANQHFIKDYQLYTKSVVLVKMREGKQTEWKNLDRIWELLDDQAAFQKYVTDEVKQFVGKG